MNNTLPDIVTAEEAAKFLRIGRSTMYRLIRSGDIKVIKIGRKFLIPTKNIINFIEKSSYL